LKPRNEERAASSPPNRRTEKDWLPVTFFYAGGMSSQRARETLELMLGHLGLVFEVEEMEPAVGKWSAAAADAWWRERAPAVTSRVKAERSAGSRSGPRTIAVDLHRKNSVGIAAGAGAVPDR